jgi:hypothetical protein
MIIFDGTSQLEARCTGCRKVVTFVWDPWCCGSLIGLLKKDWALDPGKPF